MRNLDTNVLVRYLVADEPRHSSLAKRLMEESEQEGEPLFVSTAVLCELVWVLSSTYRLPKSTIVGILAQVLDTGRFKIEGEALAWRALYLYREGKGGFADYLIGEVGRHAGCRDTVTFDSALKATPGFTVLA